MSRALCDENGVKYMTLEAEACSIQRSFSPKLALGAISIVIAMVTTCLVGEVPTTLFVAPRVAIPRASSLKWATPPQVPLEINEENVSEQALEAAVEEKEKERPPASQFWGMKTYYPKLADTAVQNKKWWIVDATNKRLGRMASEIAVVLRGKHNPKFHPAMDLGDYVIVVNAEKVIVSGRKKEQKLYRRHTTGRPGSMKTETFAQLQQRLPERIIHHAVKGMMPKGTLGRLQLTHLRVFKGPDHPHQAQHPKEFKFSDPRVSEPLGER
eukprot:GGOE01049252.1.p1 GENE.GGOE01049252.1~~GGOE01049252.1.p1  ORF type:complete len:269 (-),score=20.12 GGOE01049252.1:127-933(-)